MVMPVTLMMVPIHNVRVQTPSSPLQNRASRGETLRWAWRGRRFVGRFSRFFFFAARWTARAPSTGLWVRRLAVGEFLVGSEILNQRHRQS